MDQNPENNRLPFTVYRISRILKLTVHRSPLTVYRLQGTHLASNFDSIKKIGKSSIPKLCYFQALHLAVIFAAKCTGDMLSPTKSKTYAFHPLKTQIAFEISSGSLAKMNDFIGREIPRKFVGARQPTPPK